MSPSVLPAARLAALLRPLPADRPAYRALADALRLLVADGRVPVGTRLPSERSLVAALGASRTTVTHAYAVLRDSGYLSSRRGSGHVVRLPPARAARGASSLMVIDAEGDVIDLTCAATRAPAGTMEAYERALAELPRHLTGTGYGALGSPALREAIAARYTERGVSTTPDQIVVTSGAVAAVTVVARALLGLGDRVIVETPSYPNTTHALRRSGMRVLPLPVDEGGWDLPTATDLVRRAGASAAVLIPDFHNPTGALMSDPDRARLARALRAAATRPVVDETIAEIALDEQAPRPLPFAAHHPGTVSVGSASKSHWGGLRTGWIRAPHELVPALVEARVCTDLGPAVVEQLVTVELLRAAPGLTAARRAGLREARDALGAALGAILPQTRHLVPSGGLSLWVELPEPTSTAVALAAEDEGLYLASGPRFGVSGGFERRLRLPYVLEPEVLEEAVRRLARAVAAVSGEPPPGRRARGRGPDRARGDRSAAARSLVA